MPLKKFNILSSITLIFISITFYLKLTISDKCKSIKIFKSSLDFGLSHLDGCYYSSNLVPEIKTLLLTGGNYHNYKNESSTVYTFSISN